MKIAVIGTGISGLIAARMLSAQHDITVYEKNERIGGHTRTLTVDYDGKNIAVDTGFIVFNDQNYPLLTALFAYLQVSLEDSDMSFAASINQGWLEYGTQTTRAIFAQKRNLFRPHYWQTLRDVKRFFREAPKLLEQEHSDLTLGEFLDELQVGQWFRDYFLLPMGGAIWSCPPATMLAFPAESFVRFFDNHGLLSTSGQPQWKTVSGGSQNYLDKLVAPFKDNIRTGCAVSSIQRTENGVEVADVKGIREHYDHVILASHADQSLAMLADADTREREILSAFTYQPNTAYLHRDPLLMPKCRGSWASWVYLCETRKDEAPQIAVSYWMNRLQNIPRETPLFVTLNPPHPPRRELTFDRHLFAHPVFTTEAMAAQTQLPDIQGIRNVWFCGAWTRYGFHEDGMASGVAVAKALGAPLPWEAT